MSNCISITSVEHLAVENTLLIHYSLTCSGTWDLLQNNAAYRNVCDDYWTVMYANTQHPRHSDFPITIGTASSVPCIFAWNYGGIQGIGSENFDPSHSFLVQLGVYNTDCGLTGQTGQTGLTGSNTGSGGSNTGSNTGSNPGGGGSVGVPGPIPGMPVPPAPGPGGPGGRTVTISTTQPPGGGSGPTFEAFPSTNIEESQSGPAGNPVLGILIQPSSAGTPSVNTSVPGSLNYLFELINSSSTLESSPNNVNTVNTNVVNLPWQTYTLSPNNNETSVTNISTLITPQSSHPNVRRDSNIPAGGSLNQNSNQARGGRSTSISRQPSLSLSEDQPEQQIDTSVNSFANIGNNEGYLSRLNFSSANVKDLSSQVNLSYLNTSSVVPTSKTLLEIPTDDVSLGEKLFISTAYILPNNIEIQSTISLWLIDSQDRTVLLGLKTGRASSSAPLTLVYTANTFQSPPGSNTVISIVRDTADKIIGIATKKFVIRPTLIQNAVNSDSRIRSQDNRITYNSLPSSIIDLVNITRDPFSIYSNDTSLRSFILEKVPGSDNFVSAIAEVGPSSNAKYSLILHDSVIIGSINSRSPVGTPGDQNEHLFSNSNQLLARATDRLQLDGEDLYPNSHTVGIGRTSTSANNLLLSIGPNSNVEGNKIINIYLSDSYRLKPTIVYSYPEVLVSNLPGAPPDAGVAAPVYLHSISGFTPYVSTKLAVINHGVISGNISDTYSLTYVHTDISGNFTIEASGWTSEFGDYYSIIEPRFGTYNPYKGIVYTSKI